MIIALPRSIARHIADGRSCSFNKPQLEAGWRPVADRKNMVEGAADTTNWRCWKRSQNQGGVSRKLWIWRLLADVSCAIWRRQTAGAAAAGITAIKPGAYGDLVNLANAGVNIHRSARRVYRPAAGPDTPI
ncbi:MAG: hypothetical protein U5J78_05875 [Parasphingorhabdus sp.]|nr:hypothetical protein [Parasphingorhabdus sp.]